MATHINLLSVVDRALVLGYPERTCHWHGNGRAHSLGEGHMCGHLSTRSRTLCKARHLPLKAQMEAPVELLVGGIKLVECPRVWQEMRISSLLMHDWAISVCCGTVVTIDHPCIPRHTPLTTLGHIWTMIKP